MGKGVRSRGLTEAFLCKVQCLCPAHTAAAVPGLDADLGLMGDALFFLSLTLGVMQLLSMGLRDIGIFQSIDLSPHIKRS